VDFLTEDGFGKVIAIGSMNEFVEGLHQPNVGAIFIDGGLPEAWGLELVGLLHQIAEELPPILMTADSVSASFVIEARNAGVAQLVVKPYALDDSLSEILETHMKLGASS
jgi:DNA-binding NtrC family response regulator